MVRCGPAFMYIHRIFQPLRPHGSIATDVSSWSMFFSDRPWTTISTRARRPTGPSTISWMAWARWRTISQTSPCPPRHTSTANGRRPTTCATFASTKDTTSKTALRWASQGCCTWVRWRATKAGETAVQLSVNMFLTCWMNINIWSAVWKREIQKVYIMKYLIWLHPFFNLMIRNCKTAS